MNTLAGLRKLRKLSAPQVAEHMGVTRRTIYAWEKGEVVISIYDLVKIMALYEADAPISQIPTLIPRKDKTKN